jgi:hypothetical protein
MQRQQNIKFILEGLLVLHCFILILLDVQYSFFFKFLAQHVSDVTYIHRQEHNCSVQP